MVRGAATRPLADVAVIVARYRPRRVSRRSSRRDIRKPPFLARCRERSTASLAEEVFVRESIRTRTRAGMETRYATRGGIAACGRVLRGVAPGEKAVIARASGSNVAVWMWLTPLSGRSVCSRVDQTAVAGPRRSTPRSTSARLPAGAASTSNGPTGPAGGRTAAVAHGPAHDRSRAEWRCPARRTPPVAEARAVRSLACSTPGGDSACRSGSQRPSACLWATAARGRSLQVSSAPRLSTAGWRNTGGIGSIRGPHQDVASESGSRYTSFSHGGVMPSKRVPASTVGGRVSIGIRSRDEPPVVRSCRSRPG